MTVSVITIIHCDECKREGPEQTGKVAMINWTRMVAREYGWIIKIKQGKRIDICPDCLGGEGGILEGKVNDAN